MSNEARQMNQLLTQAKRGDRAALDGLCHALEERLRVIIQSWLWRWSRPDREDILQDTLLIIVEKYDKIEDNPHQFALQVMRNKVGDALRHARAVGMVSVNFSGGVESGSAAVSESAALSEADPEGTYGGRIDGSAMLEDIHAAIVHLPRFCKLFVVAMLEGKAVSEVWELAQHAEPRLTRSAFDKRIFVCRRQLREVIGFDR